MVNRVPIALVCLLSGVAAQKQAATIPTDPVQFQALRLDGDTNHARSKRVLTELKWHQSLAQARSAARLQDRPILLIQALGDVRGFC